MMNIWLIDHYSVPVKYYPLARQTNFAKNLILQGHNVIIFAASTVHNSDINLIEDGKKYIEVMDGKVKYILIHCHQYSGNGIRRIANMYEFAFKLEKICSNFKKPDAIISTSMTLFACKKGLQLGKKYGCKNIAQITDLWPETIVAYQVASKWNPIVLYMRQIEKWIYKNADKIIFSMEGAFDYIQERGWEKVIPRNKVYFINNGVNLDEFNFNRDHYRIIDVDLSNESLFKVIYTGSIRKVNNVNKLLDVALKIKNPNIRILIWGDGDQKEDLLKRIKNEKIENVIFKGKTDKRNIPFIVSMADLNIVHNSSSPLYRFGISFNKIFDYFAAGKPMLTDFECKYNPMVSEDAGIEVSSGDAEKIAEKIEEVARLETNKYMDYCNNAKKAAKKYDFKNLTVLLLKIIQSDNTN